MPQHEEQGRNQQQEKKETAMRSELELVGTCCLLLLFACAVVVSRQDCCLPACSVYLLALLWCLDTATAQANRRSMQANNTCPPLAAGSAVYS